MIVICEDCAKKYNIDETLIKGDKARFSCQECGHIIVVKKPQETAQPAPDETVADDAATDKSETREKEQEASAGTTASTASAAAQGAKGKGMPIGGYIFLTLLTGFLLVSAAFAYLYMRYIPEIINHQVNLRTQAVTQSFAGVIKKPLLLRNYLAVNKEAQRTSKLPGVAYASVVNKKGIVIAGFFSDLHRFDSSFVSKVKKSGFPRSILSQNKLTDKKTKEQHAVFTVGGQRIHDEVVALTGVGGEVHVGIYISDIDDAVKKALVSPFTLGLIGSLIIIGFLIFILLTRSITVPMKELTEIANRISLGEMDLHVASKGPREMRELAKAFERMRFSIKSAMERLRK